MTIWTKYVTLKGDHLVDALTDVRDAKTGRLYPADMAPLGVAVLIPPFNVRGVRMSTKPQRQPKQRMRVRA